jgi:hypothetical protein
MVLLKRASGSAHEVSRWIIIVLLFLLPQFVYAYVFFIEPNWVQTKYVKIASPKLARALSGITIIQISDLHIENIGFCEISLIERINALKPDIIFVTGDMLGSREGVTALWNLLSLLEPRFRTYAIFGESDGVISDLAGASQWDRGKASLLTRAVRLNVKGKDDSAFWLVGAPSEEELTKAMSQKQEDEPVLLINHRPDVIKMAALKKVDLVFCGHTHGGQVGIPLLQQLFPYSQRSPYISGLYRVKDTLLYVNRGISSEKGIRFFCRPEITVFQFVPEGKTHYRILPQDK